MDDYDKIRTATTAWREQKLIECNKCTKPYGSCKYCKWHKQSDFHY